VLPPPVVQVRVSTSDAMSLTGLGTWWRFRAPAGSLLAGRGRGQSVRRPCRFTVHAAPWLPDGRLRLAFGEAVEAGEALGLGEALTVGWGLGVAAAVAAVPSASSAAEPIAMVMAIARCVILDGLKRFIGG